MLVFCAFLSPFSASDEWPVGGIAPLPEPCAAHAAAALAGRIYVVAGSLEKHGGGKGGVFVYDPKANRWETKSPPPELRHFPAAVSLGGKLLLVGGFKSGEPGEKSVPEILRYDPAADKWGKETALPTPRSRLAAVVHEGKLWVLGGCRPGEAEMDVVEVYDPAKKEWSKGPSLPSKVHGLEAAVVDGKLHVLCFKDEHWVLEGRAWKPLAKAPSARLFGAAVAIEGKLFSLGGHDDLQGRHLWAYDPAKDAWKRLREPGVGHSRFAAVALDGKLYALGGEGSAGARVERYDPASDRWE